VFGGKRAFARSVLELTTAVLPTHRSRAAPESTDSPTQSHASRASDYLRFRRWVQLWLGAGICVILFGAVVRITGSGAGCGQHWPACKGELIHLPTTLETLIEYTHRLTSGVFGLGLIGLLLRALRLFPRRHPVRRWAVASVVLLGVEAIMGMLLVRFELVANDASVARGFVMPIHLVNTLLLLGAMTHMSFYTLPPNLTDSGKRRATTVMSLIVVAFLAVAASGAVTALGDTVHANLAIHPSSGPSEGLLALRFLESARAVHPVLAISLVAAMLVALVRAVEGGASSLQARGRIALGLLLSQVCIGIVNVMLSAPAFLQVLHLLVTCLIWITIVGIRAELRAPRCITPASRRALVIAVGASERAR